MPDAPSIRKVATAGLGVISLMALGLCAWILGTGGTDTLYIGELRVSVLNAARPFFVAGVAAAMLVVISPVWRSRMDRLACRLGALPSSVFLAGAVILAGTVLLIGLRYGSFLATAADSYGYLTQAELWLRGVPRVAQALPQSFPWPNPQYTFAPLGYRPSVDARAIVPTYPPGYPLLMAAAVLLFGQGSQYLVVPAMSALTVIAVFMLGHQIPADG